MNNSLQVLEFDAIKSQLKEFSRLSFSNKRLENMEILKDREIIRNELECTDEGIKVVIKLGQCNFDSIHNIEDSVIKAYKGGILNEEQLYRIGSQFRGIEEISNFYNSLKDKQEEFPNFTYHLNSLIKHKNLSLSIDRVISNDLTILDNASPELSRIRKALIAKTNELRRRIDGICKNKSDYLMDSIVTIRNDRYVIPVKNAYKNIVRGIIHDESSSAQSVFIEPEEIVIVNNEISTLKMEERVEIERLLKMLSQLVAKEKDGLIDNLNHLIEMDFMLSKGSYGISYDGMVADVSKDNIVNLHGARHPLIDKTKIIANDFFLDAKKDQIYLITGPNTGGKTVGLKTVGLLSLMNQSGLALPVNNKPIIGVFDNVFVDIGDNQNIAESLSTFSSHVSNLIYIVKNCTEKSLVLVDEIGGGTDPNEGEGLAMALLEEFHNKGCIVLATTHYHNLKTFGVESDYIVNCSMSFDDVTLKPTYKLIRGTSGRSYAFEIAESLKLPGYIIDRAKYFKDKFSDETSRKIEKLEKSSIENEKIKEELLEKQKEIEITLKEADILKKNIQNDKDKIKEEASLEVQKLVDKYKIELDKMMDDIKNNPEIKMHQVIAAKTSINKMFEEDEEIVLSLPDKINVGDNVRVDDIDRPGTVKSINKDDAVVEINGMTLKVKISKLTLYDKPIERKIIKSKIDAKIKSISPEINLIGMHVEEALYELDVYLDSALSVNLKSVRVIHGYGTGRLRKGVWEFLKTKKYIKSFHYAGEFDGAMGATIVEFK